jgi:hypothetical protein
MRKDVYLEELIQILEKQKRLLKKTIKQHLDDGEYRVAHKYSKGLGEITSRLRILYLFQDPYKDRRAILEREKKLLTDNLDKYKGNEFMTDHLLDMLNRLHNEFGDTASMQLEQFQETQHIDDALFDIASGVINSFQLVFKDENFNMKFERQPGNILGWSIGPLKELRKARLQSKRNRRALENLGFVVDPDKDGYVYKYDLTTFKDALPFKQLLARIIYDAFMRWYPDNRLKVELHRDA